MKTDIIINAATHETRIAIIEDSRLVEIWVERPDNERMVGDIYKGRIKAVIPGIQAAFVDIGMEKSSFLHISDVSGASIDFSAQYDVDEDDDEEPSATVQSPHRRSGRGHDRKLPTIESILTKEQELLVQITKEPISTKGARVTSQVTLAGRFLVLVPGSNKVGVSRKIASWSERKRLKQIAAKHQPKGFGLIMRTLAQEKDDKAVEAEIKDLVATYETLMKKAETVKTPGIIHKEMGMTSGIIRDLLGEDVEHVVVDSKTHFDDINDYLKGTAPNLINRVSLYDGKEPIFDHYSLEQEIENIFSRKVWLKSGSFLVLDHTEALTVIDVNSGRYLGKSTQEETILKINIETAQEIARQLRLRDIGGIIVIDFIDMANMEHRRIVEDKFADALRDDRSKISISQLSEFGLMEMTRQRVRPSLIHTFAEPCPTCGGIGMVQGRDTTVTKIERWLARAEAFGSEKSYTVFVHPSVFEFLIENSEERLTMLRSSTTLTVELVVDAKIGIEEYYCFSTRRGVDVTQEFNPGKKKQGGKSKQPRTTAKAAPTKSFSRPQEGKQYGRKPKPKTRRK